MPPKKVEKKEIKQIFEDAQKKLWWEYKQYTDDEIKQINEFITMYTLELKDNFKSNIKDTLETLSKLMGINPNPVFSQYQVLIAQGAYTGPDTPHQDNENPPQSNDKPQANADLQKFQAPQQQPAQQQQKDQKQAQQPETNAAQQQQPVQQIQMQPSKLNFLLLENTKIDYASLALVLYCFENIPEYEVLKVNNNNLGEKEAKYLIEWIANPNNKKIQKLFWDWNPVSEDLRCNVLPTLGMSNIQHLIIRSSQVEDVFIKNLCEKIASNPTANIQHLELYDNRIGKDGIQCLGNLISKYQKLEYLSLAKNGIQDLTVLQPILNNIGYYVLNQQELEEYKAKEKQREDTIAEAKKKKKKINEDELPKLPPLQEISPGQFAQVKNAQLKVLNLSINPLGKKEDEIEVINNFLQKLPDDFTLTLVYCNFENKQADKLKQKFKKKIVL